MGGVSKTILMWEILQEQLDVLLKEINQQEIQYNNFIIGNVQI